MMPYFPSGGSQVVTTPVREARRARRLADISPTHTFPCASIAGCIRPTLDGGNGKRRNCAARTIATVVGVDKPLVVLTGVTTVVEESLFVCSEGRIPP